MRPAAPPPRLSFDSGPTKREANKLDKLRRIQRAADRLFDLQGYDNTTMREIAVSPALSRGLASFQTAVSLVAGGLGPGSQLAKPSAGEVRKIVALLDASH